MPSPTSRGGCCSRGPASGAVRLGLLACVLGLLVLSGCGGGESGRPVRGDTTCDGKLTGTTYLTVWFHAGIGVGAERSTLVEQVAAFNASQSRVRVKLITLPEGDYNNQIRSAADRGELPDVLDFDGPYLYNYAWSGKLKPIDSCISARLRADLLPSIRQQGAYAGRTWGVGTFDSGLGLYVRRSVLENAGIRIPRGPRDAWTATELTQVLARLRKAGHRRPLDLRLDYSRPGIEWNTYGFSPTVWSAGGDLIDRDDYRAVEGYLNGPPAIKALTTLQDWAQAGYIDRNADGSAFVEGRSPISWVGHWVYDEYAKAFPDDLAIVPLPDFGQGTASGMGSWQWGVTANATDGDAAWAFISFLLRPSEIVRMTRANGAIPATRSAVRRSPQFATGGPEHLYLTQLDEGIARPRPQTGAYPVLSAAFSRAFSALVIDGRPVEPTLDRAARTVKRDLVEHEYYQPAAP